MKKRILSVLVVLVFMVGVGSLLLPRSLEHTLSGLDLDNVTEVHVWLNPLDDSPDRQAFLHPGDPGFDQLLDLLDSVNYHRILDQKTFTITLDSTVDIWLTQNDDRQQCYSIHLTGDAVQLGKLSEDGSYQISGDGAMQQKILEMLFPLTVPQNP